MRMIEEIQFLQGAVGTIEMLVDFPEKEQPAAVAVICHPHPLFGGTMHNKVVSTLARVCKTLEIPSFRFNFRGVGKSEGTYDKTIGEIQDCLSVVAAAKAQYPDTPIWLMGFSFGAYVAAKAAAQEQPALLVTVAPPVGKEYFGDLPDRTAPWILVQAKDDEVINAEAVFAWYETLAHKPKLLEFAKAGHFFHGNLIPLREQITAAILEYPQLC